MRRLIAMIIISVGIACFPALSLALESHTAIALFKIELPKAAISDELSNIGLELPYPAVKEPPPLTMQIEERQRMQQAVRRWL